MLDGMAELLKQARSWVGLTAIIAPNAEEAVCFQTASHELRRRIDDALAEYAVSKALEEIP